LGAAPVAIKEANQKKQLPAIHLDRLQDHLTDEELRWVNCLISSKTEFSRALSDKKGLPFPENFDKGCAAYLWYRLTGLGKNGRDFLPAISPDGRILSPEDRQVLEKKLNRLARLIARDDRMVKVEEARGNLSRLFDSIVSQLSEPQRDFWLNHKDGFVNDMAEKVADGKLEGLLRLDSVVGVFSGVSVLPDGGLQYDDMDEIAV
jgi:hypothetical protein